MHLYISNNTNIAESPQISVSGGGNLYVVWTERNQTNNGTSQILFTKGSNNGATFDAPISISNNTNIAESPQISVSGGGNLYVVWTERNQTTNATSQILFTKGSNNGATFDAPISISNNTNIAESPQISVSGGGNLYVVWTERNQTNNGTSQILFTKGSNNGATFDAPISISNNTNTAESPQISVSGGGNLYVVWTERNQTNDGTSQILMTMAMILKDPSLKIERIVKGLSQPTGMAFVNANTILVSERDKGTIRSITDGRLAERPLCWI